MNSVGFRVNTLPPSAQEILMQALKWGISLAHEAPVMFPLMTEEELKPTYVQALHSIDIMKKVMHDGIIYPFMEEPIASLLSYLAWDIESWIGGRDSEQEEEEAYEEYAFKFGFNANPVTLIKIKALARALAPQSEIYMTLPIINGLADENFSDFVRSFYELILKSTVDNQVDYGQYNIGIVVDGILYDFPASHPFITGLYASTRRFVS